MTCKALVWMIDSCNNCTFKSKALTSSFYFFVMVQQLKGTVALSSYSCSGKPGRREKAAGRSETKVWQ